MRHVRISADSLGGTGVLPSESALRSLTRRVGHLKATAIEGKARHNLDLRDPSLGDHSQCVLGLGLVHMAAETVAVWTTGTGHGVSPGKK